MREKCTSQVSIFDQFTSHEIGRELKGMSEHLDTHPQLLDLVADDLNCCAATSRSGLTAESALRGTLLKAHRQSSYEEQAFVLQDSGSYQAFRRLPVGWIPKRAALQANSAAITATTWEAINRQRMGAAADARIERATCGESTAR